MTIGELYVINESYADPFGFESDLFILIGMEELTNAVRDDHPRYYRYRFKNLNTGEFVTFNHAETVFQPLSMESK